MPQHVSVIIVGGGQSGLAMAWHLQQKSIPFLIIEGNQRIGDNWRQRWEGLRLFSPARYDSLPGKPFPADPWHLPRKDEAADYLESYATENDFPLQTGTRVIKAIPGGYPGDESHIGSHAKADPKPNSKTHRFTLETTQGEFICDHLVVAMGSFHTPFIPNIKGIPQELPQWHTSTFKNHRQVPEGKVLVVGAGASGQQIAVILAREGREVILSGPKVPNLPRKLLGRDVYWWMYKTGIITTRRDTARGRKMLRQSEKQGDISVGESKKLQKELGIIRLGRLMHFDNNQAILDTCTKTQPNSSHPPKHTETIGNIKSIIWATGYRNDYSWIAGNTVSEAGEPDHLRGVSNTLPGLYYVGLKFQYRINSATIGGVGADAEYIAEVIGKSGA